MSERLTPGDKLERDAMALLKRHKITWAEESHQRYCVAWADRRHIIAPRPRAAMDYWTFCHELCHVLKQHTKWPNSALGQAEEIEADLWAMRRL